MAYTILVVDDDPTTRQALAMLVAEAGYEVLTSGDVPSALHVLEDSRPDLLITDVRLANHNGLQLIAMAPRPIPTIVLTGFADPSIEADARRLGAEYRTKPVEPSALRDLIARMLAPAEPFKALTGRRGAGRRRLPNSASVRVGQHLGRVVEVSAGGMRIEVHCAEEADLPDALVLHIAASGISVPIAIVWKQRRADRTWLCGAAITHQAEAKWRAFLATL